MELMNTLDLAEHLKVTRSVVDTALKNLGLTPVYEMAQGKGTISIWDKDVVVPKLTEHFEAKRAAKPVPPPPLPAVGVDALQTCMDKRFKHLDEAINDALDDIDGIKEIVTKLADQNVLLHKALESLRMLVTDKADALQATADLLPEMVKVAMQPDVEVVTPTSHVPATLARIASGRAKFGDRFVAPFYGTGSGETGRSIHRPVGTLTTKDRWLVVDGDRCRVLQPHESRAAMGFPETTVMPAAKYLATFMLGNAVCPAVPKAVLPALVAHL